MDTTDIIAGKVRGLAPHRQREVLDFVEFLKHKDAAKRPLRSVEGIWADLGFDITEEDIPEARREMWGNFPREIEL